MMRPAAAVPQSDEVQAAVITSTSGAFLKEPLQTTTWDDACYFNITDM
jgi:hypothetical protein